MPPSPRMHAVQAPPHAAHCGRQLAAVPAEQNVARFDVPVDVPAVVEALQPAGDVDGPPHHLQAIERSSRETVSRRDALLGGRGALHGVCERPVGGQLGDNVAVLGARLGVDLDAP